MAILWSKKVGETHYEVRNAGESLRLYSNGVFHSQWNPKHVLSGHLWDLLIIPAFLLPSVKTNSTQVADFRNVLLLGVGGGAAIRSLNSLFKIKKLIGVDLDSTHLYIAKRFFKCVDDNLRLIESDALTYITKDKHKYDIIIEDIFIENPQIKGDAIRALPPTEAWFKQLHSRLTSTGILVSNFESSNQLKSFLQKNSRKNLPFKYVFSFESLRYENAIAVFTNTQFDLGNIPRKMASIFGETKTQKLLDGFILSKGISD